ncbi:MAG: ABC transporter permease, partial [Bacillota bacterium]
PAAAQAIFADIGNRMEYLVEQQDPNRPVSTTVIYFYALLAMTCLMGSTVAVDEVIKIQANMSARAARVNVAPLPKFRMFLCNISAVLLFEITVSLVVLAFLM